MDRRTFLGTAAAAAITTGLHPIPCLAEPDPPALKPMALGLLMGAGAALQEVQSLVFMNACVSWLLVCML